MSLPVDVVVDTWNLRAQACDVLGSNRFPSISGITTGLQRLSFAVQHVYAAVACDPYNDRPSQRVQHALANTKQFAEFVEKDAKGTLLRGRLTDRSGELEEKLVDVLCAVQITRSAMEIATGVSKAKAIVVISEDIDLTPAYDMARELGVPVYAVANQTVHTRPGDWLVLSDALMLDFCGRPWGSDVASQRRRTLAKQLLTGATPRKWEYTYTDGLSSSHVFRHRTGVQGHLPASEATGQLSAGDAMNLFPVDLHITRSSSFPRVRLSTTQPVNDAPQNLIEGRVVEWLQPTRVRVERSDGHIGTYEAAPGTALPGMRVAIYSAAGSRAKLVGPVDPLPPLDGWSSLTAPKVAEVQQSASSRGATVRATVVGLAHAVALLPPSGDIPAMGDRYAVVPRESDGARVSKVLAVSSKLVSN